MSKQNSVIRTGRGKLRFEIFGGFVTVEQLDRETIEEIKKKNTIVGPSGETRIDREGMGYDMFRAGLVGIEGYIDEEENELKLNDKFKEDIINFNPEFFREYTRKAMDGFSKREDLATKNS